MRRRQCCCYTICFNVKSCGSSGPVIPGATITVKDGGGNTVATGTTDSSGNYCTGGLGNGSYTWTATLTGWIGASGSATISGANVNVNVTTMRPNTIHLTDANTTIALIYDAINGFWRGCYLLSTTVANNVVVSPCVNCGTTAGNASVNYILFCTGGTAYTLIQQWCYQTCCDNTGTCACAGGSSFAYSAGICNPNGSAVCGGTPYPNVNLSPSGTYNPLSLAYTASASVSIFPIPCCGLSGTLNGPANGTITITL